MAAYSLLGMQRFVRLGWVLACGACVGQNPDWDGEAEGSSTTRDATETSADVEGSSAAADGDATVGGSTGASASGSEAAVDTTGTVSDTASDTSEADSTGAIVCDGAPAPVGACPSQCDQCLGGVCTISEFSVFPGNSPIECPDDWPCIVACVGTQACKQRNIVCPAAHACSVDCSGDQACQQSSVRCGSGPCDLSCTDHNQVCDELDFECGPSDSLVTCNTEQDNPPTLVPAETGACACEIEGC